MVDLHQLTLANGRRWQNHHVIASLVPILHDVAERLVAAKPRYQEAESKTGVP
jgi:hypothetical protein